MPDLFIAPKKTQKHLPAVSLFSTFIDKPSSIRFHNQHSKEKILLVIRKHWVTNVGWILISLLLLLLPFLIMYFFSISEVIKVEIPIGFLFLGTIFWYLAVFGFILINFLFWFYNVGIVTNERVIDVDFPYLLYSEITLAMLTKIEDITDKRGGFLSVFFDYGNVFIQTAGTEANIEFIGIPHPALLAKTISELLNI